MHVLLWSSSDGCAHGSCNLQGARCCTSYGDGPDEWGRVQSSPPSSVSCIYLHTVYAAIPSAFRPLIHTTITPHHCNTISTKMASSTPINYPAFKTLSFDIYGTLIDWETGVYNALLPLISQLPSSSPYHPSQILARHSILGQFQDHELAIQSATPTKLYFDVVSDVYRAIAANLGLAATDREAEAFAETIGTWAPFPDTVAAMQTLGKHYRLIALSNVDIASFSRTLSGPLSGVKFDAIYTAQDIGSYKPARANFEYLIEHVAKEFGARKEEILHVAQSLVHDHIPAKEIGLEPTVWIARGKGNNAMGGTLKAVEGKVRLGAVFGSLGELAEEVEKAFEGRRS
jgi:2-haloalkanoic acid dehalogenase type II